MKDNLVQSVSHEIPHDDDAEPSPSLDSSLILSIQKIFRTSARILSPHAWKKTFPRGYRWGNFSNMHWLWKEWSRWSWNILLQNSLISACAAVRERRCCTNSSVSLVWRLGLCSGNSALASTAATTATKLRAHLQNSWSVLVTRMKAILEDICRREYLEHRQWIRTLDACRYFT